MKTTGVIIARFQTPYLHKGHQSIINHVAQKHNRIIVVLGITATKYTKRNPFDFYTRERMTKTAHPNLIVLSLADHPSDKTWSQNLDQLLALTFQGEQFILYGSRDSFIPYYNGKLITEELPEFGDFSATEIRNEISDQVMSSQDFRAGINYACHNMYPKVYPAVDIAVFRNNKTEILLGKKATLNQWRFVGGFVDPTDDSYEAAAKRELKEECGAIETGPLTYELSTRIDDWRFRKEEDKITTTLFSTDYQFGTPKAADDIIDTNWIKIKDLNHLIQNQKVVNEHLPLFHHIIAKYSK